MSCFPELSIVAHLFSISLSIYFTKPLSLLPHTNTVKSISGFEATTKRPYRIGTSQMTRAASSNLGLHLPAPYGTSYRGSPRLFHFPQFFKPIKAMAGDSREKLDHLQKLNKNHSQPKRRVAPVAPIGLWDRFPTAKTVQEMMETMERMMEDPFAFSTGEWPSSPVAPSEGGGYRRGRTPWEIKEGEDEYKMRFDMPGMTKEDVKVWVEEKMLVVKAEKAPKMKKKKNGEEEEEVEEEEWSARSYGRYNSRIALPQNVQFEKIKAEVKDGVLYITIPKATTSSKILDIDVQ